MSITPPASANPTVSTQKQLLEKRDAALRTRFTLLYKTKRMRIDDVIAQLVNEFFITERTIRGILKADAAILEKSAPTA